MGALLVVYLAFPIGSFLYRTVGSHDRGFGAAGLWPALSVSLQGSTISLGLITLFGVPLAFALARHPGRLATLVAAVVQVPLALPPLMSGILLVYVVGPYSFLGRHFGGRLTDTLTGVVIAQSFVSAPFLVVSARSAFATVDPGLDDVAATLGYRRLARFLRVDVPAAAAGIRAGMVLSWLRAFGEYGATVIIAYHPFSLPIYLANQFSGYPLSTTEAPTLLALVVSGLAVAAGGASLRLRSRHVTLPLARAPDPRAPVAVDFDLEARVGSFHLAVGHAAGSHRLAVVGPSGSGKSMTLRALAGLLGPGAGLVSFAGRDMTAVPTERRRLGYVPQGYALMAGRSVWRQVCFGVDADPALAAWWLRTLHLDGLVDRTPEELSGGQRQRVSLARALAGAPDLLLLDEPFAALDAPVRDELRRELRRLQQQAGLSTVLVTHDPVEAAVLADEIIVVADGNVLQAGTVAEVFGRPASLLVGRVLGVDNLSRGTVGTDGHLTVGALTLPVTVDAPAGTALLWRVPAEAVEVGEPRSGALRGEIIDVIDIGVTVETTVRLEGGLELRSRDRSGGVLVPGGPCGVGFDPSEVTSWATVPTG